MAGFVDARIIKNTYKGGDVRYVVEVGYEEHDDEGQIYLDWRTASSLSTDNRFAQLEAAERFRDSLLNNVLVKSEVVE